MRKFITKSYSIALILTLLFTLSVGQMWAATLVKGEKLYADVHSCGNWISSGSKTVFRLWTGDGGSDYVDVRGTDLGNGLWSCTVSEDNVIKVQLNRRSSDWEKDWAWTDIFNVESGKNVLKPNEKCDGDCNWLTATWYSTTRIYATPSTMSYTDDATWDENKIYYANIKIGDSEWLKITMTKTDYEYSGEAIYAADFYSVFGGVHLIQFQIYDGETFKGQKVFDKTDPDPDWSHSGCITNIANKIYNGTSWLTYGRDITIYAIPQASAYTLSSFTPGTHTLYANVKVGSTGAGEWLATKPVFEKTAYKYNDNWIYKATVFAKYNVIVEMQFQQFDGDSFVKEYDCNPGSEYSADDIDGKIFGGWVSKEHTWYNYATDIAFDQQSGSGGSSSVTATVGSSMPAATMPTRTGYTFGGYFSETNGGGDQYYNADGFSATDWIKDGPTTLYAKWSPVDLTYNDASTDGKWSTASNWSPACVPTIDHDVVITKPVTVDITNARAKSVVIDQSSSNTGKLTINAGKELVIATTLRKTTDGSSYGATAEEDIFIDSSPSAGLGALVMGSHDGTNQASVNFYSKSHGVSESEESVAQYLGIPFNTSTVLSAFYNSWVYRIDYLYDGGGTGNIYWVRMEGNEAMVAFKGYAVFADENEVNPGHYYWMQGTLTGSNDHECYLFYNQGTSTNPNNETLVANSWMAPIKITAFETSDFVGADASIYIFNAGSLADWKKAGGDYEGHYDPKPAIGDATPAPGQYSVYPIKATAEYAKYTGETVIPAMQSFSVYTDGTVYEPDCKLILDYSRLVYDPAIAGTTPSANRAPRRDVEETDPELMRLYVQAESGYSDKLLMLEREDFEQGFENGWDGRKIFGESFAPQLYAMTQDGNMAINCIPDFEGTVLGFKPGDQDTTYTFYFRYEGAETLYLNDLKAQQSTRINGTNTYSFTSAADDSEARFVISATPIATMPTGCENISAEAASVRKLFLNGHICIIRGGRMYDATGAIVK